MDVFGMDGSTGGRIMSVFGRIALLIRDAIQSDTLDPVACTPLTREQRRLLLDRNPIRISFKRINDDDRRSRRRSLDYDMEYRNRVKRRIMEGLTAKQMAPLFKPHFGTPRLVRKEAG